MKIGMFGRIILAILGGDAKRPVPGETWRMNFGREAFPADRGQRVEKCDIELSLWSPDMELRDFGNPNAFGKVIFR